LELSRQLATNQGGPDDLAQNMIAPSIRIVTQPDVAELHGH